MYYPLFPRIETTRKCRQLLRKSDRLKCALPSSQTDISVRNVRASGELSHIALHCLFTIAPHVGTRSTYTAHCRGLLVFTRLTIRIKHWPNLAARLCQKPCKRPYHKATRGSLDGTVAPAIVALLGDGRALGATLSGCARPHSRS